MTHNAIVRRVRWSVWALAVSAVPLGWWACTSHPLAQPVPEPEQETDLYISVSPIRQLDLIFMIDNSPSMAPKQDKLKAQFPKLVDALKDLNDRTLPDLRVAIINSDLGTGGAWPSGSCGPRQLSDGQSLFGDKGRFQMVNAASCGVMDDSALWLEYKSGHPVNYRGDIGQVFGCLASGVGTLGCGEEHQLQAFELALVARGIGNDAQQAMLRPEAYLGLVFLSDEDDCSAATNEGMFGERPELASESASLRCSTRAYSCNGKNLADSPPGYPTSAPFQTALQNCSARTDACPNAIDGNGPGTDTSGPTGCSPLRDYKRIAAELKALKTNPDEQILVAGIFGWPLGGDFSTAEPVKIDLRPNPNQVDTAHPYIYDYWSLCYDPNHRPSNPDPQTGFDAEAWGWGAGPGIRESAFIDEFGSNGLKFSICETDYSDAMSKIGAVLVTRLDKLCVAAKLYNTDFERTPRPATVDQLGADCRVAFRAPQVDPGTGQVTYVEQPQSLPRCKAGATNGNVDTDCWQLTVDHDRCGANGQLIRVLRTGAEVDAGRIAAGTKIGMECRSCPNDISNLAATSDTYRACSYGAF
jgi:hypothetical protein